MPVTVLNPSAVAHRDPAFLPDGKRFLYLEAGPNQARMLVGGLDGSPAVPLLPAESGATYAGRGQLLFVRQGTLMAQGFDPETLALTGSAQPLVEHILVRENDGRPVVSASLTGALAYRAGGDRPRRQFVWYDRAGKALGRIATPVLSQNNPELSPDGTRLALQRNVNGNTDVWLLDLARGTFNRLTNDPAIDALPVWSADGRRLVFTSNRGARLPSNPTVVPSGIQPGTGALWTMPSDASGVPESLITSEALKWASDWSHDGKQLLFRSMDPRTGAHDIWATTLDPVAPTQVMASPADERDAQFSPDGRWVAYQSDEAGRPEIYVQRFPGPGAKERISASGGTQVRWRADGRELFYVTESNEIASVQIQLPADEGIPRVGSAQLLFATRMALGGVGVPRQQYVVSADGQRFLVNEVQGGEVTGPITLLLHWNPAAQNTGR